MAKQISYLKSLTGTPPKSIEIRRTKRRDIKRIEREAKERERELKERFSKKPKERKKRKGFGSALKGAFKDATRRKGGKSYATSKRTSKRRKKSFGLSLGGYHF